MPGEAYPAPETTGRELSTYGYYDLAFSSDIPFPEASAENVGQPSFDFEMWPAGEPALEPSRWCWHGRLVDGEPWLSVGTVERGHLLRFAGLADFLVLADGKTIRCYPRAGVAMRRLRQLFLNQVVPRVLHGRMGFFLHASAVIVSGGAVAFLGESGYGKSTLAASFCRDGYALLTDDGLFLKEVAEELFAIPSRLSLSLWPDAAEEIFPHERREPGETAYVHKQMFAAAPIRLPDNEDGVSLRRAYVLSPPGAASDDSGITFIPQSAREAFEELVQYVFRLDIHSTQALKREFDCLSRLVGEVPFYRLSFPRRFSALPHVRDAILEHLTSPR